MYIQRAVAQKLAHLATKFPVIALLGPRQSGKTTVAQETFPRHTYFSLEDPDIRIRLQEDMRSFLEADYGEGVIIDEFQNEPQIVSYIQGIVDKNYRPGYFILTGSHNFLMNQAITQSLAGRVGIMTLLPLSVQELKEHSAAPLSLNEMLFTGSYPALYSRNFLPAEFYGNYLNTYVEKDVRQLINLVKLTDFQKFIRLCAGRIGQLLEVSSLADDCAISVPTVKAWLSILEASYIIFLLQPHFVNFSKRLVKSPKIYFYDTGLACYLLRVISVDQLSEHYLRGGLFESFILSDMKKHFYNKGEEPPLYFWRDNHQNEIDCIIDYGTKLVPVEIKSSKTFNERFFEKLGYYSEIARSDSRESSVVYGGDDEFALSKGRVVSWRNIEKIVK